VGHETASKKRSWLLAGTGQHSEMVPRAETGHHLDQTFPNFHKR
jgi:hypothetical protein